MVEEPGITTLSVKGQVVIPQKLREHLGMGPHTKFLVYGDGDTIVLRRLVLPDVRKEWKEILAAVNRKGLKVTEADVRREVAAVRRKRRKSAA